jgi:uncharacterized protein (DUF697 family)
MSANAKVQQAKEDLIRRAPPPLLWLFGKAQSGKSSLVRYLTGQSGIAVGQGFRPTTRQSAIYEFPNAEAPLLRFLDTRGLGESAYDPAEDLERYNSEAHMVMATVRLTDLALEPIAGPLAAIRRAKPTRPIILVITCLHLAYPQQQHPPYPFTASLDSPDVPPNVARLLGEQRRRLGDLVDYIVPVDLTPPEEGFTDPHYGGPHLRETLLRLLPESYRQAMLHLKEALAELKDLHARQAMPHIMSAAALAGTAGAVPLPLVDIPVIVGLQTRLVHQLAELYGVPKQAKRFMEMAGLIGVGVLGRIAVRQLAKWIPVPGVGSVAGGAYGFGSTFALGKTACWYYGEILAGHLPSQADVNRVLGSSLQHARTLWQTAPHREESA